MEAVPQPHENWKSMLMKGQIDEEQVHQFALLLACIHTGSQRERQSVEEVFSDRTFFEALRIEPYYSYAGSQVPETKDFFADLVRDTLAARFCLVHGDYSPKNILVHKGKLILLDHEVIHFGDPAFDVGFCLTHFLSKANHFPQLRSRFAQAAGDCWNVYQREAGAADFGPDFEARVVRNLLGCLFARVTGRSPLEYLDARERGSQSGVVVALMREQPLRVEELVTRFIRGIETFSE
jgi:thiamine kinase-like enzyme